MPGASGFFGSTTFRAVLAHGELRIGGFVTVSVFAGPHRIVTGVIEDSRHAVFGGVKRVEKCVVGCRSLVGEANDFLGLSVGSFRQMPKRATGHNHVTRGHADSA